MESSSKQGILAFFVLFFLFFGCKNSNQELILKLEEWKSTYAKDSRTSVFTFSIEDGILRGETDQIIIKNSISDYISSSGSSIIDSIRLLPSIVLKLDTLAYINVSVGNIRTKSSESAELATQALLGTPLRVLDKSGSWYRVQTPDKYIGFIENSAISFAKNFERNVVYSAPFGFSYQMANSSSHKVSDLTFGDVLEVLEDGNSFKKVGYPDGRVAFVESENLTKIADFVKSRKPLEVIETSQEMLGVPYLWGGTSWKGVDCSGFTRTSFLMNGIYLPRDASQQAIIGDPVNTESGFGSLKEGDLLFFGSTTDNGPKVTHVALYLGKMKFIHASGMVKYGSFNPASEYYDEYNLNRFLFAKRIIGSQNIRYLNAENFY
jgi:hypothetical protein